MATGGVTVSGDWLDRKSTQAIFDLLDRAGHQVFAVGGAVRNALLGVPVADVDFATDAVPDRVLELAAAAGLRTVPTGIEHGTVLVIFDGQAFEVTTYRRDVETDGRRAVVAFAEDIETDAHRRDFTINALYADRRGRILDPLGGLGDIDGPKIRFVDNAVERIREDALRALRYFRFFAWYGNPATGHDTEAYEAIAATTELLDGLSRERVGAEMRRLLAAPDPAPAVASMVELGVLERVLPGADPAHLGDLVALEKDVPGRWLRRLSLLAAAEAGAALRLSRAEATTLKEIGAAGETDDVARMAYRYGAEAARDAAFIRAARSGTTPPDDLDHHLGLGARAEFPVRAADIREIVGEGPVLGAALKALEEVWIASRFTLSRGDLMDRAHEL